MFGCDEFLLLTGLLKQSKNLVIVDNRPHEYDVKKWCKMNEKENTIYVEAPSLEISSTVIRNKATKVPISSESLSQYLDPQVQNYLVSQDIVFKKADAKLFNTTGFLELRKFLE